MYQVSVPNPKVRKQDRLLSPDGAERGLPHLDGWLHCQRCVALCSGAFVPPRRKELPEEDEREYHGSELVLRSGFHGRQTR